MQQKASSDLLYLHHVIVERKKKNYATKTIFRSTLAASFHSLCKPEVMLSKISCVHGMVRPPIG